MRVSFSIARWAAWAPGLETREAWLEWASSVSPQPPVGDETPALLDVPPMRRRRVERLGRFAYQVAQEVQGDERGWPLVFASRHGESKRSAGLLDELARDGSVSPAGFALSVHNAIAGVYGICRNDPAPTSAVANGRFTLEAAVLEAVGLLGDGHPTVGVVMYDTRLPEVYQPYLDEPEADFAFCWAIQRGEDWSLSRVPADLDTPSRLPHALEVFRFFLARGPVLTCRSSEGGWRWERHG
jgi:hypothetical protein